MTHMKSSCHAVFVGAALCLFAGCAREEAFVNRTAVHTAAGFQPQSGRTAQETALVQKHCPFGEPKLSAKVGFGPVEEVFYSGYVLLHSSADKIPLWVCEYIESPQLGGTAERRDNFYAEPGLKAGERAELSDYAGSGFDRGHQAPAADFKSSQSMMDQSFSLANMAPQYANLNRKIWQTLEDKARRWIKSRGAGYIITGPVFYDPAEDEAATATGVVRHAVIGRNGVAVPTHFYKIVVAKNAQGVWESIAFVLPNLKKKQLEEFEQHIYSIDWIEERTGINFMPSLNSAEEERLERHASEMW